MIQDRNLALYKFSRSTAETIAGKILIVTAFAFRTCASNSHSVSNKSKLTDEDHFLNSWAAPAGLSASAGGD